jgi:hypothetical protein
MTPSDISHLQERPPRPPADPVPSLSSLNGPFQLAEYLALKVRHDPHDIKGIVEIPTGDGSDGGKGPDKNVVSIGSGRQHGPAPTSHNTP